MIDNYLNPELEQYPMEQCETCMHARVCGLAAAIPEIMEGMPISMDTAVCHEYLQDIQNDQETSEPLSNTGISSLAYTAEELIEAINTTVGVLESTGVNISYIEINSAEYSMLADYLVDEPGDILVVTQYGKISVVVNEEVPLGLFFVHTDYSEEEGDED